MRYELRIESMHCERCASSIERYLRNQPGVGAAEVDFQADAGWIEAEPTADIDALVAAIDSMGYAATLQE